MNNKESMKKGIYFVCAVLLFVGAYLLFRQFMEGKVKITPMKLKPSEVTIDRFDGDYIYAHNSATPRQWAVFDLKEKQIAPWDDVEYERTGDLVCVRKTTDMPSQYSYTYYDRQGKNISQLTDYFVTEFYQGYAAIQKNPNEPILLIDKNYSLVRTLCNSGYEIYQDGAWRIYTVIGKYLLVEVAQGNVIKEGSLFLVEIETGKIIKAPFSEYSPFMRNVSIVEHSKLIDRNFQLCYEDKNGLGVAPSQNKDYLIIYHFDPLIRRLVSIKDGSKIPPTDARYQEVNADGVVLSIKENRPEDIMVSDLDCFLLNLKGERLCELPQEYRMYLFGDYIVSEDKKILYHYKNYELAQLTTFEEIYNPQFPDADWLDTKGTILYLKDGVYYKVSYR